MIIKSFVAESVAGALKLVKSELGGDAVILKTRKLNPDQQRLTGARIEVTACIDQSPAGPTAMPAALAAPVMHEAPMTGIVPAEAIVRKLDFLIDIFQTPVRKDSFSGNLRQLFAALLQADVPERAASEIVAGLAGRFEDDEAYDTIALAAADRMTEQLPSTEVPAAMGPGRRVVLVGPPGSGKTSLMARLAGHLVSERKLAVRLASLDQIKVAAPEEIQTYAAILDVDYIHVSTPNAWSVLDRQDDKMTLIDTPAINPRDRKSIKLYGERIARMKPDRVIGVLPALHRFGDLFDTVRAFAPLRLSELAVTMVDQTDRLGAAIALSIQTGLPITIMSTGPGPTDVDLAPDLRTVIELIVGLTEGGRRG